MSMSSDVHCCRQSLGIEPLKGNGDIVQDGVTVGVT